MKETNTPPTPENTPKTQVEAIASSLSAFDRLMIAQGKRKPPIPPAPALTHGEDAPDIIDLPRDLTAASISKMTQCLDKKHPASSLNEMNAKLYPMLMVEDDQMFMLRRQAQTLDTLFHTLINLGFKPDSDGNIYPRMEKIAAALKTQSQASETVRGLKAIEYTDAMRQHLLANEKIRITTPLPRFSDIQKEGID